MQNNGMTSARGIRRFRGRRSAGPLLWLVVFATGWSPAHAEGWEVGGHLKYQYNYTEYGATNVATLYGADPANDHSLDGRLKAEWRGRGWDFAAHYEALALAGDSVVTRRNLAAAGLLASGNVSGLPNDRQRLFDLTDDFIDKPRTAAVHRLDRLSIGYTSGHGTLRFGRQAISWGNGLAFQALDFVNPFSPLAIDKDYKTGEDMLYGQWLWSEVGDFQFMALPRRNVQTRELDHEQASYAVKLHARAAGLDLDVLTARHYDQTLLGLGAVRSLGGAVWRGDILHVELPGRDDVWLLVTNLDYSWVWFGKNMYGFAEYFRNGFGARRNEGYLTPDPELVARLLRGELFTNARDYMTFGLQVELTPLVNVFGNMIFNLNDGSRLVQLRGLWDARENLQLMAGMNLPAGQRGTEYGGIPVVPGGPTLAPGRSLFLRAAYYF